MWKKEEINRKLHAEELLKREEKIKQVLKANENMIRKKIEEYNIKQEKLREQREEKEEKQKKKQRNYPKKEKKKKKKI